VQPLLQVLQKLLHILLTSRWRDIVVLILIFTSISSWIIGVQMRRKIRRDLGRKATEEDLTSIDAWMKVDEVEHPDEGNHPLKRD
jgi:hypothetical protein